MDPAIIATGFHRVVYSAGPPDRKYKEGGARSPYDFMEVLKFLFPSRERWEQEMEEAISSRRKMNR